MEKIKDLLNKYNLNSDNPSLYEAAFRHPSCNLLKSDVNDYERLEFLGDAVLEFVITDLIFKTYPSLDEGKMTKIRIHIVQSASLAKYAKNLSLDKYIQTSGTITKEQINNSNKILEDVFEAFLGAIYLDLGIDVVSSFIKDISLNDIKNIELDDLDDPKSLLQEQLQNNYKETVEYRLVSKEGPDHDPTFVVEAVFNNSVLARGVGKSKKAAEAQAAKLALAKRSL